MRLVAPDGYFLLLPLSVRSTARKASCGTSTEPSFFMRFLPSFCFSSKLALARHIAAVALGGDVLAQRLDVATRNDVAADRCLHGHVEHLSRDQLRHRLDQFAASPLRIVAMSDGRQGIDALAVDQQIEAYQRGALEAFELVVERGVATADGLQPVEEVQHHFGQRQLELELYLRGGVLHALLHAPLLHAQADHRTHVFLRHQDAAANDRLTQFLDLVDLGQRARVVDFDHLAGRGDEFVDHGRRGGDQIELILALQALLHDLHVQHAEKPDAEPEAQCSGGLGLVAERRVVQRQLLQRFAEGLVVLRIDREQTGEHARLHLLEARQRRIAGPFRVGQRIADRCATDLLHTGDDEAHVAGTDGVGIQHLRGEAPHAGHLVVLPGRHDPHALALAQSPVDTRTSETTPT
jgi:hypothetical protein